MGSFNVSCSLSGKSINCGDRAVLKCGEPEYTLALGKALTIVSQLQVDKEAEWASEL